VLVSGGAVIKRLVFSATQGLAGDALTPEDVARDLEQLMDVSTAQIVAVGFGAASHS